VLSAEFAKLLANETKGAVATGKKKNAKVLA